MTKHEKFYDCFSEKNKKCPNLSPLLPLSPQWALAPCFELEVAGGKDRDDACCHDDCGRLKMSWLFPWVSTCLRRLRLGNRTGPPSVWDWTPPTVQEGRRRALEHEWRLCTRLGVTCWPVSAPKEWGTLLGDTIRLHAFPFMSFTTGLLRVTSLSGADQTDEKN